MPLLCLHRPRDRSHPCSLCSSGAPPTSHHPAPLLCRTCQLLRQWCFFSRGVAMRSTHRCSNRRQPRVVLQALMRDRRSWTSCGIAKQTTGGRAKLMLMKAGAGRCIASSNLSTLTSGSSEHRLGTITAQPHTHLSVQQVRAVERQVTLRHQSKLGDPRVAVGGAQQRTG